MILASASPLSLALGLSAAAAYAVPALAAGRLSQRAAHAVLALAWALHAGVLLYGLLGPQSRFGFAPALSMTAWLVLTLHGIEQRFFPQWQVRWALAGLGALAVLLGLAYPGPLLHTQASSWLALHWVLGVASYGLFAAAVLHAWIMTRNERRMRLAEDTASGMPLLVLERLTFRFVGAGFVLLSATLLAGAFFGEQLDGGSGWRWDHKTVFSLLSWLTIAVLLIGRYRFGWRGRKAVRVLYIGAGLLLLAYVGSRFVLEVLLERAA